MTIPQAARQLRLSEQLLRCWIQSGRCPFGYIIREGQRNTYLVVDEQLKQFIEGENRNE